MDMFPNMEQVKAAQLAAEAAEEERVQRFHQMALRAGRRIQLIGLAKGWNAWHEQYVEAKRQMQMLQAAGARLSRPMLVATFMHWRDDWDAVEKAAAARAAMGVQEQLDEAIDARDRFEIDVQKLQFILKQQRETAEKDKQSSLDRLRKKLTGVASASERPIHHPTLPHPISSHPTRSHQITPHHITVHSIISSHTIPSR